MRNPEYEDMLNRENEQLKKECGLLRDKVANLSRDLDGAQELRG